MRHSAPNLASSGEPDAAEWVARLHNRPNDLGLRRDFDSWLKADPANKPAFDSAADAWSRLGALIDEPEIAAARASLNAELAAQWPVITTRAEPLAEAPEWDGKPDKLQYLQR